MPDYGLTERNKCTVQITVIVEYIFNYDIIK